MKRGRFEVWAFVAKLHNNEGCGVDLGGALKAVGFAKGLYSSLRSQSSQDQNRSGKVIQANYEEALACTHEVVSPCSQKFSENKLYSHKVFQSFCLLSFIFGFQSCV